MEKGRREFMKMYGGVKANNTPSGISVNDLPTVSPINSFKLPMVKFGESLSNLSKDLNPLESQLQEESVVDDDSEEMGYLIANSSVGTSIK